MKKNLFAIFFALLLLACEDTTISGAGEKEKTAESDLLQSEKFDDLPGCTKNREGYLSVVKDSAYLCRSRSWMGLGLFYESENKLPNCSSKREGYIAFALDTRTQYICSNKKWRSSRDRDSVSVVKVDTIVENEINPYYSSGTFCWSEDCTPESSDSAVKSSSSTAKSSSSGAKSSSSAKQSVKTKYDCSTYSCVTTQFLNQEMLAEGKYGDFLDVRDGQVYKTIKIGSQTWMAEDLRYCPPSRDYCSAIFNIFIPVID